MTKPTLAAFCQRKQIAIDLRFGPSYGPGQPRDDQAEMAVDFRELIPYLEKRLLG